MPLMVRLEENPVEAAPPPRVAHTAGMSYPASGPQMNQMLAAAGQAAEAVSGDAASGDLDGALQAPEGTLCALCGAELLPREATRRGPEGLRHESCP